MKTSVEMDRQPQTAYGTVTFVSLHYEEIRRQVLSGKRSWGMNEYNDDRDVFFEQAVLPLRRLEDAGMIERLEEIRVNSVGETYVGIVEIVGAVNLGK